MGPTFFPGVSQQNLTLPEVVVGFSIQRGASEQRMEYHDKVLKCAECSQEFVFTAGEQMFFADKGFKNEPKRCKDCKAKRSQIPGPAGPGVANFQRAETKTTCSQCGKETTVPFRPTQGRPVFCRECFQQRRSMSQPA